jgi:hypothetical protein
LEKLPYEAKIKIIKVASTFKGIHWIIAFVIVFACSPLSLVSSSTGQTFPSTQINPQMNGFFHQKQSHFKSINER